jgi:hypothetical protein
MLDLLSGGLTIVSGVMSLFGGDDEADSARATARAERQAAWDNALANNAILKVDYDATISALNLNYENAVEVYNLKRAAYNNERQANALTADAVIEQSRIDKEQIRLQRDDELRQLEENVRAAKLEREYSFDAAKTAKTIAKEDAKDFRRAGEGVLASSRALQAASGFQMTDSPALVDEKIMAKIEEGVSASLHKGDVEFWDEMRTVQSINRYIINQGVDKAATLKASEFNLENLDARTSLELRAVAIQRQQTALKEKEAMVEKHQAEDEAALNKFTAKQSYAARKNQNTVGARGSAYASTATANARVSSAKNAGMDGLVRGVSSGLNAISKSSSFQTLAAKGGIFR